jgi:hypothetical protein
MPVIRGKAHHLARYKQVIDYSGLLFERGITPTDIDGLLDFGGKLFVFLELKLKGTNLPYGQRLALERVCDGLAGPQVLSVVLVAGHNTPTGQEIRAAEATVVEYRWRQEWNHPKREINVRQAIEKIKSMPI